MTRLTSSLACLLALTTPVVPLSTVKGSPLTGHLFISNKCSSPIYYSIVQRTAAPMISIPAGRLQNLGPFIPHYCDDKGCTGVSIKFSQSIDDYNDILQFEYTHTPSSSIGFANRLSYDFSSIDGNGGLIGLNRTVRSSGWECPRIECRAGQRQCGYMFPRDDKNTHVCGAERDVTVEFCGGDTDANGSAEVAVQQRPQTLTAGEGQDDEQDGDQEEDRICCCPCRKSKEVKAPKLRLFNGYDLPPY